MFSEIIICYLFSLLKHFITYDNISLSDRVQGAVNLPFRREVVRMSTYEVLTLLLLNNSFLVALLTYLDNRNNQRK